MKGDSTYFHKDKNIPKSLKKNQNFMNKMNATKPIRLNCWDKFQIIMASVYI